jgi:hypothetical protein
MIIVEKPKCFEDETGLLHKFIHRKPYRKYHWMQLQNPSHKLVEEILL